VNIREAAKSDHAAISRLVTAAFGRSDEAVIVDRVRAAGEAFIEFIAEIDSELVGHVLFNRMQSEPAMSVVGLAPLAVAPQFQGRGVGSDLTRRGLDACRQRGAVACIVLGNPAYYGRFGFAACGDTIRSPYAHLPAFQALDFDGRSVGRLTRVDYPDAFN
jgi:putative acetyltransferase